VQIIRKTGNRALNALLLFEESFTISSSCYKKYSLQMVDKYGFCRTGCGCLPWASLAWASPRQPHGWWGQIQTAPGKLCPKWCWHL